MNTKFLLWGLGAALLVLVSAWFTVGYLAPEPIVIMPDTSVTSWYKPWTWGDGGTHAIAAQYATKAANVATDRASAWTKFLALGSCGALLAFFGVLVLQMDRITYKTVVKWDNSVLRQSEERSRIAAHAAVEGLAASLTERIQQLGAVSPAPAADGPVQSDGGPYTEQLYDSDGNYIGFVSGAAAVEHRRKQALKAGRRGPKTPGKNPAQEAMLAEARAAAETVPAGDDQ